MPFQALANNGIRWSIYETGISYPTSNCSWSDCRLFPHHISLWEQPHPQAWSDARTEINFEMSCDSSSNHSSLEMAAIIDI